MCGFYIFLAVWMLTLASKALAPIWMGICLATFAMDVFLAVIHYKRWSNEKE